MRHNGLLALAAWVPMFMEFTRGSKFHRGGARRKKLHGLRVAADKQFKVDGGAIREDHLGHNLDDPGHTSVSIWSELPNSKIVGISEARRHFDDRIPTASSFEVWLKLGGPFSILSVVLAVGIKFGRITGCIERIWAMEVCSSKRDRR